MILIIVKGLYITGMFIISYTVLFISKLSSTTIIQFAFGLYMLLESHTENA